MWTLTICSNTKEQNEYPLKPGKNTIGRLDSNDIQLNDISVSRLHAEVYYDENANTITIRDVGSFNRTCINQEYLVQARQLCSGDEIRIGQQRLRLAYHQNGNSGANQSLILGTQPLTREFMQASMDHHAYLWSEVAERLNTVIDLETALREVSQLMQKAMGADKCQVILAERFNQLGELGFPTSIARPVIEQHAAVIVPEVEAGPSFGKSALLMRVRSALCVPILSGEKLLGLVYMYKTRPLASPFNNHDLQLAVAISHQAALTIQRTRLLGHIRREQQVRQFLQRFLSPRETEALLQDYLRTGHLPGLTEQVLTILVADVCNSTGLAERLGALRFGEILSRYYQAMTEVVFNHQGQVNKYLGDGLMAVFGNFGKPDPEAQATQVALAMLDRLETLNGVESEPLTIGIGINTGLAVSGYLGADERIEYTVLGDAVNIAFRLEPFARPNRILIGPDTFQAIAGRFNTRPIGPLCIRGRTQPIETYEVVRA